MITPKMIAMLKKHEGFRARPYRCTAGKLTIGYGFNLDENDLPEPIALMLLMNKVEVAEKDATSLFYVFDKLSDARQGVLVDMAYNLGKSRLSGFKKFIAAVNKGDFQLAVKEMLDSTWAKQVKGRATELANIFQRGEW